MNWFSNQRFFGWAVALLVLLNLISLAALWHSHRRHSHRHNMERSSRPPERAERIIAKELSLTKEQKVLFKQLRKEHHAKMKAAHHDIREAKEALFELLKDNNTTNAAVEKRATAIAEIQKEIELNTYHHFSSLKDKLDGEQKKKLNAIFGRVMEHMARRGLPPHHAHKRHKRPAHPEEEQ